MKGLSTYNIYLNYVYLKSHAINSHAAVLSEVFIYFTIPVIMGVTF